MLARGDEKWPAWGPVCVEMAAGPDEAGGLREERPEDWRVRSPECVRRRAGMVLVGVRSVPNRKRELDI